MSDKEQSEIQDKEKEGISAVAEGEGKKKISLYIFLGLAGLAFIWVAVGGMNGGEKEIKKMPLHVQHEPDYEHESVPAQQTDAPVNKQLTKDIRDLHQRLTLEKLAEDQKIYKLRQNAPTQMYTADGRSQGGANYAKSGGAPVSSKYAGNPLPLNHDQINALKSSMGQVDPNMNFKQMAENDTVQTVQATRISNIAYTVTQGTLIPGILQTAINSDLPGMIKANVSMDIYAQSGQRVLIPKGSTLIGEYNSGLSMGQRRVMVMWTRLIRPDGVSVMLGSPGTDSLGRGGLGASSIETRFWARFGQSSLLSIIGSAVATAGVSPGTEYNSASAYRLALANNFQQTASSALMATMNIKPTIHIHQGERINVFVNRDVSFYGVLADRS